MGAPLTIRPIQERDAAPFLELCQRLDAETRTMLLEPDERATTVEQQAETIRALRETPNQAIFVAEQDAELIGYIAAYGGRYRRNRHSAMIVIGIRPTYGGQGVGTRLFETMERWARQQGLHRLELTVMAHNQAALALYVKMGFAVEGKLRHTIRIDGAYIDEYAMAKLLT